MCIYIYIQIYLHIYIYIYIDIYIIHDDKLFINGEHHKINAFEVVIQLTDCGGYN